MLPPRYIQSAICFAFFAAVSASLPAAAQADASQAGTVPNAGEAVQPGGRTAIKRIRVIPPSVDPMVRAPFSHSGTGSPTRFRIEMRPAGEMTRDDQDLAANAESSIQERAGFDNLEFNQGKWTYTQLGCSALPNHLFLRFSRDDGTRQMSMFSASIPRNGEGRVRVIPIVRRGYSLFSPAPINALTVSAFNHIRAEEQYDKSPDWVGTGLCYAALAGANPEASNPFADDALQKPLAQGPVLRMLDHGGAAIVFADIDASPHPMEWAMTFDRKGRLVKATHVPASVGRLKDVPKTVQEMPGKSLPGPTNIHGN